MSTNYFPQSNRLIFRHAMPDDIDFLFKLETDPDVYQYLPKGRPFNKTKVKEQIEKFVSEIGIHEPFGVWFIESKATRDTIAWCLMLKQSEKYVMGYVVSKDYWSRGYGSEIAISLRDYGISHNLNEFYAVVRVENLASIRILEKTGFKLNKIINNDTIEPTIKEFIYIVDK